MEKSEYSRESRRHSDDNPGPDPREIQGNGEPGQPEQNEHEHARTPEEEVDEFLKTFGRNLRDKFKAAGLIESITAISTTILAVVTVIAVCIYGGQLTVMRGQLNQMAQQYPEIKRSAAAAEQAAHDADQSLARSIEFFKIDERARLRISSVEIFWSVKEQGNPLTVNIHYSNVGKTEAQVIAVDKHVTLVPYVDDVDKLSLAPVLPVRMKASTVLQQGTEMLVSAFNHSLGPSHQPEAVAKQKLLVGYGCIEYRNIFGETDWIDFCQVRQPPPNQDINADCYYKCKREPKR